MTLYTLRRRFADEYIINEPWIKVNYSLECSKKFRTAKEANEYRINILKDVKFYCLATEWVIIEIHY